MKSKYVYTFENFKNEIPFKIKSFTTQEGRFSVWDIEENVRHRGDMFTVYEHKDGWIIRNSFVPENLQRKGIATDFYTKMNKLSLNDTGNPLRSTQPRTLHTGEVVHELSNDAIALWDSFVEKGIAEKLGYKNYRFKKNVLNEKVISNITLGFYDESTNVTKEFLELHRKGNKKELNKFLNKNKGNLLNLYHGTSSNFDIKENGLLTTKLKTKRSYQSEEGYVYLSIYPDSAKLFGEIAYPKEDISVYKVEIAISNLKSDKDQLRNKRLYGNMKVGDSLAESAIYGNGFRVKGDIPPYMITLFK